MSGPGEVFDPYHKWLGIAPQQQPPHYYRLLGIDLFEEDPDVIAAAADRQMAHVRSYQSGRHAEASHRLLNELATARLCLLTPEKKRAYDASLRARLADDGEDGLARSRPPPLPPGACATSVGRLVRDACRYVWAEGQRFWIWQTRLPGVYWRLGVDVYREGRYRSRFARLYSELETTAEKIEPTPPSGRKARLWRRLGLSLRRALENRRRAGLLRTLGQAAYEADQDQSGPAHLTHPIRDALARLADLRAEVAALAQAPPGHTLSPRRLAWIAAGVLVVVAILSSWVRWLF
ncbi:MAG: hypothetical protein NUV77_01765 [Thermoguttaceae bacterium]|jgi:hypothetical protein|nr:hypothetical protein [Thermoguttaceae bacterium]